MTVLERRAEGGRSLGEGGWLGLACVWLSGGRGDAGTREASVSVAKTEVRDNDPGLGESWWDGENAQGRGHVMADWREGAGERLAGPMTRAGGGPRGSAWEEEDARKCLRAASL